MVKLEKNENAEDLQKLVTMEMPYGNNKVGVADSTRQYLNGVCSEGMA